MRGDDFSRLVEAKRSAFMAAGINTPEKARLAYDMIRVRAEMHLPMSTLTPVDYAALVREVSP